MFEKQIRSDGNDGSETRKDAKITLLVVDDHEVVRKGLALVLGLETDFEICGEAGNGLEAIKLAQRLTPDVILMDYKMPGMDGIEAAKVIKASVPSARILILTGVDANNTIFEALESGIDGYILKEVPPDELIRAIHVVANGQAYLHPAVTRKVLTKMSQANAATTQPLPQSSARQTWIDDGAAHPVGTPSPNNAGRAGSEATERLSDREREVLMAVALGQNNREIAEKLIVGEETVRTHLKSAFRKLGVNDRTQAVVVALKQGLISL